jgi:decaprenylphospho-beta-D-ribofuranose 2-oxidase
VVNPVTVAAFNEAWFRKAPLGRTDQVQSIARFFHPLDGVRDWNRVYGATGFLQYQFVVADGDVIRRIVGRLSQGRAPAFLAVLKRFGPAGDGHLSFPVPGWTLTIDLPAADARWRATLDAFDDWVVEAGGRVYLAKDARMRRTHLEAMYPRLDAWREVRHGCDPRGLLVSDLDRRLNLSGRHR